MPTSIVTDDAEFQIIKSVGRLIEELTPSFIDDKIKNRNLFFLVAVIMKNQPVRRFAITKMAKI